MAPTSPAIRRPVRDPPIDCANKGGALGRAGWPSIRRMEWWFSQSSR
ncbi:MAG: hypothetical protein HON07_10875 [Planctomycetaceae bacterium]|nr:hypothetical protein [Planctomycetaceae bacterium]